MNAKSLIKKQDAILKKFGGAPHGKVYKRIITMTGGDKLTGRPGSVTYSDTELNPQPYYQRGGRTSITGERIAQKAVLVGGKALTADQAVFVLSPTAISLEELQNPNLVLIIKRTDRTTETFQIEDVDAPILPDESGNGTVVSLRVYARSVRRD